MAEPANYSAILEHVVTPDRTNVKGQLRNFLEVVLLINGARSGVLIDLDPTQIPDLARLLSPFKVHIYPHKGAFTRTQFLISKTTSIAFNHISIGKALGYMTPINISSAARNGKESSVHILVDVNYNGKSYTDIQLYPQIVCGFTEDDIKHVYESAIDVLQSLDKVFSGIHISNIDLQIKDFVRPAVKKTRRQRKQRRSTTYKLPNRR